MFDLPTRETVIESVAKYVNRVHGNDWHKAFGAADTDDDGRIDGLELGDVLKRAGVGMALTRGTIVRAILKDVDTNGDGVISRQEFMAVFQPSPEVPNE